MKPTRNAVRLSTRACGVRPGQGGFSLVGLALALVLTTVTAIWASNQIVQGIEDAAARSTGVWLTHVRQAAASMAARHFDALANGRAPKGEDGAMLYADPSAPTLSELRVQAHLPADFPEQGAMGFGARIHVIRGGACPGERCRVDVLIYSAEPVLKTGDRAPDLIGIATVIDAAQGHGGAIWPQTPDRVRGAAFNFPNPPTPDAPAYTPSTVALWAGVGAGQSPVMPDLDPFVRIGDARDPMLQGSLSAAGSLKAGAYLAVGARAQPGHACGVDIGTIASAHDGDLLTCQSGVWRRASSGFGGAFSVNHPLGCRHYTGVSTANPVTGECSCPPGFAGVIVSAGGKWTETEGWTTGYVCVR